MIFKKAYSLERFIGKTVILYRVKIRFKNGKVKIYRKCVNYRETREDIILRVLDKKGYEINIIKTKHYIKDIIVNISGLAWHYEFGKYFYRRLFNEIYYYD